MYRIINQISRKIFLNFKWINSHGMISRFMLQEYWITILFIFLLTVKYENFYSYIVLIYIFLYCIIEYFYFYIFKVFITYEVFNYHIIILVTSSLVWWGNCSCVLHLAMNSHPSTSCAYRIRNVIHRERITCRTRRFICGKIKNKHRAGGS